MAAFTTLALLGLGIGAAAAAGKKANTKTAAGQSAEELLSGKGPSQAALDSVGAQVPNTTLGQAGGPKPPEPPDAGLAQYNAIAAGRAAADRQRKKATGMGAGASGGAPSALTGTASYAPRTLLGS